MPDNCMHLLSHLACTNSRVFPHHCCEVWQVYTDYNCVFAHCCHVQWALATPVFAATKYGHYPITNSPLIQLEDFQHEHFCIYNIHYEKLSTQTYLICMYMHVTASSAKGIIIVVIIYNILHITYVYGISNHNIVYLPQLAQLCYAMFLCRPF